MAKKPPAARPGGPGSKVRGKTRSLLMEDGLKLFSTKGFEGVSVGELEEAVGLKAGSGSFYRHFADKEALLKAILDREIERARQRRAVEQEAIAHPAVDIRVALTEQFRLTLRGFRENAQLLNLLTRGADHFPALKGDLRKSLVGDALKAIVTGYEQRIRAGEMIEGDPLVLANVVQSALYGYVCAELTFGKPANAQAAEAALIETLVVMLLRRPLARSGAKETSADVSRVKKAGPGKRR